MSTHRYEPYPAYKDSDVEWLGKIPECWNLVRISELMTLQKSYLMVNTQGRRARTVLLVH